jgi:hypothetical protein
MAEEKIHFPVMKEFISVNIEEEEQFEELELIDYESFKKMIEQSSFIKKFMKAIQTNLNLKKEKYFELYTQFANEKKIFDEGGNTDFLRKNANSKNSATTLEAIKKIIQKIDERLAILTEEEVSKNLKACIYDPKNGLETLIGRREIKNSIALRFYSFSKNPKVFFGKFANMRIYAPSGAGKTKIASVLGYVFGKSGILVYGDLIFGTKQTLVSEYVNDTTNKTRSVAVSSLERVLFIDEAYNIVQKNFYANATDHGNECIVELINFMDKMIGLSITIFCGYQKEMEEMMLSNEGLERRFLPPIILKPYSPEELTSILIQFIQDNEDLQVTKIQGNYIYSLVERSKKGIKKEAGDMLNLSGKISIILSASEMEWQKGYKMILNKAFNEYFSEVNV